MAQYLSFEEVASKLKCSIKKVRQLVIEDKSLRATRITPNGLVLTECGLDGHFPYDLDFNCHLDDEGAITSDIYRIGANGETEKTQTLFVGYLRVECSELARFITEADFVDLPNESTPTKTPATLPAQTAAIPAKVVAANDGSALLPAVANWKMLIQAEAAELFLRLLASGANPTAHSLVKQMAEWCRNNEIKTDGNINPSEGYIRTHVLGGEHWTPPTMSREQARKHVAQVAQTKVAQVAH